MWRRRRHFQHDVLFRAESAAHRLLDHPDAGFADAHDIGGPILRTCQGTWVDAWMDERAPSIRVKTTWGSTAGALDLGRRVFAMMTTSASAKPAIDIADASLHARRDVPRGIPSYRKL
jgi:hypothetical protein